MSHPRTAMLSRAKDGLEQLLQILCPSIKHPFHSISALVNDEHPFSLDLEFVPTVPYHLSPIGHGGLGTRLNYI